MFSNSKTVRFRKRFAYGLKDREDSQNSSLRARNYELVTGLEFNVLISVGSPFS